MTLRHFPPNVTAITKINPEDLAHYTRNIPDDHAHPGMRIVEHFQCVTASWHGKVNQTYYGRLFEISFYDALVHYGIPGECIDTGVDISSGHHAEIDIVVRQPDSPSVGILLKTSLRERWKQIDRDALVVEQFGRAPAVQKEWPQYVFPLELRAVFFREGEKDTVDTMRRKATTLRAMFASRARLATVLDGNAMNDLFRTCGADL